MTWGRVVPRILASPADGVRASGDALYGFRDLPHTFLGANLLRQVLRSLRPGRVLTFALDAVNYSEDLVACRVDGKVLFLADGAVRIAKRTNAILLSASVHRVGCCRFEFRFGEPVPDHLMETGTTQDAMNHLARQLCAKLETDPTGMGWCAIRSFAPKEQKEWIFP